MPSLDLLVPALAGYLFLRLSNFTKFGLLRESGYHEPRMWEDLKVAIPRADVRWARLFDPYLYSAPEGEALPEELGDHD